MKSYSFLFKSKGIYRLHLFFMFFLFLPCNQRKLVCAILEEMKTHFCTVWIVTDLETAEGRLLAYNSIRHLKRSHTMRVAIINNPKDVSFFWLLQV